MIEWDGGKLDDEISIECVKYKNNRLTLYASEYDIFVRKTKDKKFILFNGMLPLFGLNNLTYKRTKKYLLFNITPVDDIFQSITKSEDHRKVLVYRYCVGFCKVNSNMVMSIGGSITPYFYTRTDVSEGCNIELLEKYFADVTFGEELREMLKAFIEDDMFLDFEFRSEIVKISEVGQVSFHDLINPIMDRIRKFL